MLLKKISALLLLGLFAVGCADDIRELDRLDGVAYDAQYAFPVIDSRVSLDELIGEVDESVSLTVDPNGLLIFNYSGEVPAVGSDIIFGRLDSLAGGIPLFLRRNRQALPFGQTGELDLRFFRIKAGILQFAVLNPYDEPVSVEFVVPNASLDGEVLRRTMDLPAYNGTGDLPVFTNRDAPIDLNGYELNIEGDSLYVESYLVNAAGDTLVPGRGSVMTLNGLRFSLLEGYLGQELYPGVRDTIEVDFFDRYLSGEVNFIDPTITVTVTNSFGVPARAVVDVLDVMTVDGEILSITGPAITSGFDFIRPTVVGESEVTVFVFNRENSNIDEILSSRPVAVDYSLSALINPDEDTDIFGFVTDSSAYSARMDVRLPLVGSARDFTVLDTFDLNIGDRYEDVTDVLFRLTTINSLPLDVSLTGSFIDSLGNVLTDLTDGEVRVINAGPVDADGNPTGTNRSSEDFTFSGERVDAIRNANRLVVTLTFATTGDGSETVRITSDQELQVLLGAIVSVSNP